MENKIDLFKNDNPEVKLSDFPDMPDIQGLKLSSTNANLYENQNRDDLTLFSFDCDPIYSVVFTKSKICSQCIIWNRKNTSKKLKGIFINTQNANTLNGKQGYDSIKDIAKKLSQKLNCKNKELLFASTGIIGEKFPIEKINVKIDELVKNLGDTNKLRWVKSARAIMTTDTIPKMTYSSFKINNHDCTISGIAKGSGMIFPKMGTMLSFIFSDIKISQKLLDKAVKENIATTFNSISVDGDTSTNDMVVVLSTQKGTNRLINKYKSKDYEIFKKNLKEVMLNLSKQIVMDGEGAKKFIEIVISNAKTEKSAKNVAFSIANSQLVKTAIAGEDPNWGRILMAVGKCDENLKLEKLKLSIGNQLIYSGGKINAKYNEEIMRNYMKNHTIKIEISLNSGTKSFKAYTCDLTHDYISINANYRN